MVREDWWRRIIHLLHHGIDFAGVISDRLLNNTWRSGTSADECDRKQNPRSACEDSIDRSVPPFGSSLLNVEMRFRSDIVGNPLLYRQ